MFLPTPLPGQVDSPQGHGNHGLRENDVADENNEVDRSQDALALVGLVSGFVVVGQIAAEEDARNDESRDHQPRMGCLIPQANTVLLSWTSPVYQHQLFLLVHL